MSVAKTAISMAANPKAKTTLAVYRSALAQKLKARAFLTTDTAVTIQHRRLLIKLESCNVAIDTSFRRYMKDNDTCATNNHRQTQQNLWYRHHPRRFFSAQAISSDDSTLDRGNEEDLPVSWKEMYDLLVAYHQEHGSTIVPDRSSEDDKKNPSHIEIGKWVKVQRQHSRFLSQQQKNLLNKLGFVWDHLEAQWLEKYERLCDYESEMRANEISSIRSSELESVFEKRYQRDPVLRRWVNAQRQKYRSETISAERVRLLEKVEGFVWDVKDARWFEMHRRLSLFAEEHNGSCIVPQHYAADPQLACWVSNQRHRKHQLSAERISMLDALGFVWDVRELQWMVNYENYKTMYFDGELTETCESNDRNDDDDENSAKDGNKHRKVTKEEQQLIDWAIKQRRANRNGTLSAYRKHQLDALVHPIDGSRFIWDPQGQNWMEMYNELLEFRKIHKHVMVPTRSTRHDEQIDANENAADGVSRQSDSTASTLQSSISTTSASSSSNRQLGVWVANQRRNFKKGTLSKKRKKLLDDINFV